MAKFSLATNERFKDKDGNWQDRTEWHSIVAWQRTAEVVGEYCKKGSQVYIEGRLKTDSWDDKETGQKKYRTDIVVNDLVLLGGRGGGEGGEGGGGRSRRQRRRASMDQRTPEPEPQPARRLRMRIFRFEVVALSSRLLAWIA